MAQSRQHRLSSVIHVRHLLCTIFVSKTACQNYFFQILSQKNAQIVNLKNPDVDLIRRIHPECGFYGFMIRFWICPQKCKIRFWIPNSGFGFSQKKRTLNQQESNFARAAYFFVHFFAVFLHDYNVKRPETSYLSYNFNGENVVRVLFHFFFTPSLFHLGFDWWPLVFLILSPPLQNFDVVLPSKKCPLSFLSLALYLYRLFSH